MENKEKVEETKNETVQATEQLEVETDVKAGLASAVCAGGSLVCACE